MTFLEQGPNIWLGEGTILLRDVTDRLRFFTRWILDPQGFLIHEVEIVGFPTKQTNIYTITQEKAHLFISLENETLGLWEGHGLISDHHLHWRLFSADKSLSSEEHFFHLDNGRIKTRGLCSDKTGVYTVAEGEIWLKAKA